MKKVFFVFLTLLSLFMFNINAKAKNVNVYVFHSNTCPHCKASIDFLESIKDKYDLDIYKYDVQDTDTQEKIKIVEDYFDVSITGVPVVIINNKHMRGYTKDVTDDMYIYNIKLANDDNFIDEVGIKLGVVDKKISNKKSDIYDINLFGKNIMLNKNNTLLNAFILGFIKCLNPLLIIFLILYAILILLLKPKKHIIFLNILIDIIIYTLFSLNILKLENLFKIVMISKLILSILFIIIGLYEIDKSLNLYNNIKLDSIKNILLNNKKIITIILFSIFTILIGILKVSIIGKIPWVLINASLVYKVVYVLSYVAINILIILISLLVIRITKFNKYKYSKLIYAIVMFVFGILLVIKSSILGL